MHPNRRHFLQHAGAIPLAALLPHAALAQAFPTKPVQGFITTAPGGSSDITTRLVSLVLGDRLGQTFIMDNRPGAGGNIAAEATLKAPADGYSFLAISKGNLFINLLYDNLRYEFARDFTPMAGIATGPLLMLIHPSVPATTVPEFIAYAKANPTKVNYATPGIGSDPHLTGEWLKQQTGLTMPHVPYRGGALALNDLLSGNVQLMFSNLPAAQFIKEGKLRALAVTGPRRAADYPDLPTMAEFLPGFVSEGWYAFVMRKGTPTGIIEKLNSEVAVALRQPRVMTGIAALTAVAMPMSVLELEKFFASEFDKWSKVIKAANIKAE